MSVYPVPPAQPLTPPVLHLSPVVCPSRRHSGPFLLVWVGRSGLCLPPGAVPSWICPHTSLPRSCQCGWIIYCNFAVSRSGGAFVTAQAATQTKRWVKQGCPSPAPPCRRYSELPRKSSVPHPSIVCAVSKHDRLCMNSWSAVLEGLRYSGVAPSTNVCNRLSSQCPLNVCGQNVHQIILFQYHGEQLDSTNKF